MNSFADLNLIGASPAFRKSLMSIERIARLDATVLVTGETGTGKELAARALHYLGPRRDRPFVAVNCGAIPDHLVESEFFGHARGAFTDAREAREGLVASASGGTLFLDEIEAMSLHTQRVLLRFLQDKEYRPVGANAVRHGDVRIVAASNCDLFEMTDKGHFRLDLLHRINQLTLDLPPLRYRTGDVPLLAREFVERLNRTSGEPPKSLHPDSLKLLEAHDWPGNVRELENLIQREFLMADGPLIHISGLARPRVLGSGARNDRRTTANPSRPRDAEGLREHRAGKGRRATDSECLDAAKRFLSELTDGPVPSYQIFKENRAKLVSELELAYLKGLLTTSGGNLSLAARISGRDRSDLCKLVKKHALERSAFSSTVPDDVLHAEESTASKADLGVPPSAVRLRSEQKSAMLPQIRRPNWPRKIPVSYG